MKPSTRNILIIALLFFGLVAALAWTRWDERVPTDRLLLAGNVRPVTYTVSAPRVTYPTADYAVGIPTPSSSSGGMSSSGSGAKAGAAKQAPRSSLPVVAGRLTEVAVRQGDTVAEGDTVATLDTTMLELGVKQSKAALARAKSDVSLMSANLDTVATNQSKLSDAKAKIREGASQLTEGRSKLENARKQLVATRKKALAGEKTLEAQIQALEQQIAQGSSKPPTATPGPTPQQILATLKAKLAELSAGIKKMDAGLAKIDEGKKKLDDAEKKLASAKSQMATGASALSDAKKQLKNAKDVLGKVADAREVAVQAAEAQLAFAEIVAPVDGVVTFARSTGEVAMVGAPIVRIAPTRVQEVDTYLTAEQLERVHIGSKARVGSDSLGATTLPGRVAVIGSTAIFPPTNFPTDIVHMTRAVKVTVAIDSATHIPAGTPVDLTIFTTSSR